MKYTVLILSALILSACASHSVMRGSVAMKVSDREAHVCMGKNEVKEGDKVIAFYNDCQKDTPDTRGAYGIACVKTKLGAGIVKKVLNDHYSVVEFEPGVKFTEGSFVEKQ